MMDKATGKIYPYETHMMELEEFSMGSLEDCENLLLENDDISAENIVIFKVDEAYKPIVNFEKVVDGCIW